MSWFETKKALLAYLGKNENDRKLVDRLILRGEVYMEDGMYYIVDKDAIIEELRERVSELEGKIATFKESNWDLEELKVNCKYWEDEAKKYAQYCADIVDVCYRKVKASLWSKMTESSEEFKEWIQKMVKWEE